MSTVYADGNRFQIVGLVFAARIVGGALGLSNETLAAGYYPPAVAQTMDVFEQSSSVHPGRAGGAASGLPGLKVIYC